MNSVYYTTSTNSATHESDVRPSGCSHRQCQFCCCNQLVASAAEAAAGGAKLSFIRETYVQLSKLGHGKAWGVEM